MLIHPLFSYDLDACDIQEKYPDGFTVSIHVTVHKDTAPAPLNLWQGFSTAGVNPKILFSNEEERREIMQKFGKANVRSLTHTEYHLRNV